MATRNTRKGKTASPVKITDRLARAVALAQVGMSNKMIGDELGLTPSQVQYKLSQAKTREGYEPGQTYRSEWKAGTSFAARTVVNSIVHELEADAEKRLPTLFEHPTPRVSPIGRRE